MTPNYSPPPNSSRKVLYAVLALAGVFVSFLGVVFVAGIYQGFTANRGRQKVLDAIYATGVNAPGAAEVRAVGCQEALVVGPEDYRQMRKSRGADEKAVSAFVLCKGPEQLPDCATVARAYAATPNRLPGTFFVSVQSTCSRRYSESGEDLDWPP